MRIIVRVVVASSSAIRPTTTRVDKLSRAQDRAAGGWYTGAQLSAHILGKRETATGAGIVIRTSEGIRWPIDPRWTGGISQAQEVRMIFNLWRRRLRRTAPSVLGDMSVVIGIVIVIVVIVVVVVVEGYGGGSSRGDGRVGTTL